MAAKKSKKNSRKSIGSKASKFRLLGKYFLIVLVLCGQGFLAYIVVDKNYEQIYSVVNGFYFQEPGTYQLEKIVTNVAGTNARRYLLVEISLELVSKDDVKLIEKSKLQIRHSLIEYLSTRTVDQLEGVKKRERLRVDLVKIINNAIGIRSVRNLYYTRFIMQ